MQSRVMAGTAYQQVLTGLQSPGMDTESRGSACSRIWVRLSRRRVGSEPLQMQ
jgi:hypothetical protein